MINRLETIKSLISSGKVPQEIYKYIAISPRANKMLLHSSLWLASPLSFNDPFDCQINDQTLWTEEKIAEQVDVLSRQFNVDTLTIPAEDLKPESFSKIYNTIVKKTLGQKGITCFSKECANLLMWAHYSSSHTGICLKFDIIQDPDFFWSIYPIKYDDKYPEIKYKDDPFDELMKKAVFTKSINWEIEKEIRVYKEEQGWLQFKKECLTEIIFGCKTSPEEIITIKKIVDSVGYTNLTLKQAYINYDDYSLGFRIL